MKTKNHIVTVIDGSTITNTSVGELSVQDIIVLFTGENVNGIKPTKHIVTVLNGGYSIKAIDDKGKTAQEIYVDIPFPVIIEP